MDAHNDFKGFDGFDGESQPTSLPTDPKIIGPGTWYSLHKIAIRATTREKCIAYVEIARSLVEEFPCGECRQHGTKFIESHPFEKYIDMTDNNGRMIGMFIWSWEFHNMANRVLGKPILAFSEAFLLYDETDIVCIGDCSEKPDTVGQSNSSKEFDSHRRPFDQTGITGPGSGKTNIHGLVPSQRSGFHGDFDRTRPHPSSSIDPEPAVRYAPFQNFGQQSQVVVKGGLPHPRHNPQRGSGFKTQGFVPDPGLKTQRRNQPETPSRNPAFSRQGNTNPSNIRFTPR